MLVHRMWLLMSALHWLAFLTLAVIFETKDEIEQIMADIATYEAQLKDLLGGITWQEQFCQTWKPGVVGDVEAMYVVGQTRIGSSNIETFMTTIKQLIWKVQQVGPFEDFDCLNDIELGFYLLSYQSRLDIDMSMRQAATQEVLDVHINNST